MRRFFASVRVRLFLLALLAILPSLGLVLYTNVEQRRLAAIDAEANALRLAHTITAEQARLTQQGEEMLMILAQIPEVRSADSEVCSQLFAQLLAQRPEYANLGAANADGDVVCSAVPLSRPVNIADRSYFRNVQMRLDFAAGEFQIGRITGRPGLNLAYPVLGDSGDFQGVVFAALDLAAISSFASTLPMPEGSTVAVIDQNGTVIARYPDPERWTGTSAADVPLVQTVLKQQRGTLEADGMDGVERLYVFEPLNENMPTLFVYAGIPRSAIYGQTNFDLRRDLAVMALVAALTFGAAWYGSHRFILHGVNTLIDTTRRLRAGDLSARANVSGEMGELGELVVSFNEMVAALEQRTAERQRAEDAEHQQRLFAEALASSAAALNSTLNIEQVLEQVLFSVALVVPHDAAHVMLREGDQARIASYHELAPLGRHNQFRALTMTLGEMRLLTRMAETGQPFIVTDTRSDPDWHTLPGMEWIRSYAAAPICHGDRCIGFLNLLSTTAERFTAVDAQQLKAFADQAAIAIQNARLYHELEAYSDYLQQAVTSRTVELERTKEQVEAILHNSPDAILLLDAAGRIRAGNRAFQQMFGCSVDQVYSQPLSSLVDPKCAPGVTNALQVLTQTRLRQRLEAVVQPVDAHPFEADIMLARVEGAGGIDGIVCNIRDIVTFKQVERMKDQFISNVSHELRTPITSLKLNLRLISMNPEKQAAYIERLNREVNRLNEIIESLLQLSRLEQGRVSVELVPVDLNAVVEQFAEDRTPMVEGKGLTLKLDLLPGPPTAQADESLVNEVLSILLTNAINYTPAPGQIAVSTRQRQVDGRSQVGFCIRDTGPGITPEDQPHLFERFYRGLAGHASGAPGTGLGLPIAKEIVTRHRGEIDVQSTGIPGEGTAITVWLEAAAATQDGAS